MSLIAKLCGMSEYEMMKHDLAWMKRKDSKWSMYSVIEKEYELLQYRIKNRIYEVGDTVVCVHYESCDEPTKIVSINDCTVQLENGICCHVDLIIHYKVGK